MSKKTPLTKMPNWELVPSLTENWKVILYPNGPGTAFVVDLSDNFFGPEHDGIESRVQHFNRFWKFFEAVSEKLIFAKNQEEKPTDQDNQPQDG